MLEGIDLAQIPPILGFSQTTLRNGAETILEIESRHTWFPLLAAHQFGKGKASACTTSASPHWGVNLVKWDEYTTPWKQLFTTL